MRSVVSLVGGLLLLAALGYYVSLFVTADTRVHKLCDKIAVGMTVSEVASLAREAGLGPAPKPAGVSFLVEKKTFGRYGCRVETADGIVRTSKFDVSN